MARERKTPDDLRLLADEFEIVVSGLRECADQIDAVNQEKPGYKGLLIHGKTIETTRLPELLDWIGSVKIETENQLRAYKKGLKSTAELNVERNAGVKTSKKKTPKSKT